MSFFFLFKVREFERRKKIWEKLIFFIESIPFPELTIQSPSVAYKFVSHKRLPHVHYVMFSLSWHMKKVKFMKAGAFRMSHRKKGVFWSTTPCCHHLDSVFVIDLCLLYLFEILGFWQNAVLCSVLSETQNMSGSRLLTVGCSLLSSQCHASFYLAWYDQEILRSQKSLRTDYLYTT